MFEWQHFYFLSSLSSSKLVNCFLCVCVYVCCGQESGQWIWKEIENVRESFNLSKPHSTLKIQVSNCRAPWIQFPRIFRSFFIWLLQFFSTQSFEIFKTIVPRLFMWLMCNLHTNFDKSKAKQNKKWSEMVMFLLSVAIFSGWTAVWTIDFLSLLVHSSDRIIERFLSTTKLVKSFTGNKRENSHLKMKHKSGQTSIEIWPDLKEKLHIGFQGGHDTIRFYRSNRQKNVSIVWYITAFKLKFG